MAEEKKKEEKKEEKKGGHDEHGEKKSGGGLMSKLPVLLGGVMILEAVVLFAGFKFLGAGAPRAAVGAELTTESTSGHGETATADEHGGAAKDEHASAPADEHGGAAKDEHGGAAKEGEAAAKPPRDKKAPTEVLVVKDRFLNTLSGKRFLYDVEIVTVTKGEFEPKVKAKLKDREALIKDRIRMIIAQSDPEKLTGAAEPGLETLRRQVKYQLEEIVGEGIIDDVLVPRCIPFRAD